MKDLDQSLSDYANKPSELEQVNCYPSKEMKVYGMYVIFISLLFSAELRKAN